VIELKDADTAGIFTEVTRGIDKWLWFFETSQLSGKLSSVSPCTAEAERTDTDASFNAYCNA